MSVDGLASIMGCGVSSLLLKHIGLPLEIPFKAKSIWDGVIERIEYRLAGWNYLLSFSKLLSARQLP